MSQHAEPPTDASVEPLISTEIRSVAGHRVVTVGGEVDMATTPQLRATLAEGLDQAESVLIIDLSGVRFLGSSGLAVLVEMHETAVAKDVELRLVCRSREVVRPLEATGLTDLFDIHPDLDNALGAS